MPGLVGKAEQGRMSAVTSRGPERRTEQGPLQEGRGDGPGDAPRAAPQGRGQEANRWWQSALRGAIGARLPRACLAPLAASHDLPTARPRWGQHWQAIGTPPESSP